MSVVEGELMSYSMSYIVWIFPVVIFDVCLYVIVFFLFFQAIGTLQHVEMPQNGIQCPGVSALASALAVNTQMRILNLNDNTFTEAGSIAIAKVITILFSLIVSLSSTVVGFFFIFGEFIFLLIILHVHPFKFIARKFFYWNIFVRFELIRLSNSMQFFYFFKKKNLLYIS